jgi:hypothetical protein
MSLRDDAFDLDPFILADLPFAAYYPGGAREATASCGLVLGGAALVVYRPAAREAGFLFRPRFRPRRGYRYAASCGLVLGGQSPVRYRPAPAPEEVVVLAEGPGDLLVVADGSSESEALLLLEGADELLGFVDEG